MLHDATCISRGSKHRESVRLSPTKHYRGITLGTWIIIAIVTGFILYAAWCIYRAFLRGGKPTVTREITKGSSQGSSRTFSGKFTFTTSSKVAVPGGVSGVASGGAPGGGLVGEIPVDGLNVAHRILGKEGDTTWEINYITDREVENPDRPATARELNRYPYTHLAFTARAASNGEHAWQISDINKYTFLNKLSGDGLTGGLVKLASTFSGPLRKEQEFHQRAKVVDAGSAEWRSRYTLAAIDPRYTRILDAEIESLFLHWPHFNSPLPSNNAVVFVHGNATETSTDNTQRGHGNDNCLFACVENNQLRVQLFCRAPNAAVIEHLTKLGQALIKRCEDCNTTLISTR